MYDATPQRSRAASSRARSVPVSPRGYPLVGHLPLMRDLLGAATQFRSLGDIVKLRLPPYEVYVLNHPRDIEQWLVQDHASYRKDWTTRVLENVLGQGLLVNEGSAWRKQRRIVQPEFTPRRVDTHVGTMRACADRLLAKLLADVASQGTDVAEAHADTEDAAARSAETSPAPELGAVDDARVEDEQPAALDAAARESEGDFEQRATVASPKTLALVLAEAAAAPKSEHPPESRGCPVDHGQTSASESLPVSASASTSASVATASPAPSAVSAAAPVTASASAAGRVAPGNEESASSVRERVAAGDEKSGRISVAPSPLLAADGSVQSLHALMMRLSLDMAGQTLFGADTEAMATELSSIIDEFVRHYVGVLGTGLRLPDWVPTRGNLKARKNLARLHAIVGEIIAMRRRDEAPSNDFITRLINARDERGRAMPDRLLIDEAVTMLLAGHETTALLLTYAIMLLAQHPEVERRVLRELNEDLPLAGSLAGVERLPYLDAVLRETLRLYPPAYAIGREALVDTKIGDCKIPRGAQVWAFQWSVQRDPRFFHQAERFRPERWVHGETLDLPRFAYFPFAGGPRVCPGAHFAMVEAKVALATLLPKLRFNLVDPAPPKLVPTVTMRPKDGVPVRVALREADTGERTRPPL